MSAECRRVCIARRLCACILRAGSLRTNPRTFRPHPRPLRSLGAVFRRRTRLLTVCMFRKIRPKLLSAARLRALSKTRKRRIFRQTADTPNAFRSSGTSRKGAPTFPRRKNAQRNRRHRERFPVPPRRSIFSTRRMRRRRRAPSRVLGAGLWPVRSRLFPFRPLPYALRGRRASRSKGAYRPFCFRERAPFLS